MLLFYGAIGCAVKHEFGVPSNTRYLGQKSNKVQILTEVLPMALVSKSIAPGFAPNPYVLPCKIGGNQKFGTAGFARNSGDSDLLLSLSAGMSGEMKLDVPGAMGGGVLIARKAGQPDFMSIIDNLSNSCNIIGYWNPGQYQIFFLSKASTAAPRSGTFNFRQT